MKLEVNHEQAVALALLDESGDVEAGLHELLRTVVAGVVHGGGWEAAWVDQACGEEWRDRQGAAVEAAWDAEKDWTVPGDRAALEAARCRDVG